MTEEAHMFMTEEAQFLVYYYSIPSAQMCFCSPPPLLLVIRRLHIISTEYHTSMCAFFNISNRSFKKVTSLHCIKIYSAVLCVQ